MIRRDSITDDDTLTMDHHAWQRLMRDNTPIEYWHSLDLSYAAYQKACQQDAEEAA